MPRRLPAALAVAFGLAGPAAAQSGAGSAGAGPAGAALDVELLMQMSSRVSGEVLASRIAAAKSFPLGSRSNPVRVLGPRGERAYLARLRCPAGDAPAFRRIGSFGAGPYESIIDGYDLHCADGRDATVYMDMYHPGHDEMQAPAGFALMR